MQTIAKPQFESNQGAVLPPESQDVVAWALYYNNLPEVSVIDLYGIREDGRCGCGKPTCTKYKTGKCTCAEPCCPSVGKHPKRIGWEQTAQLSDSEIRERFSVPATNVGLMPRDGLAFLDFDRRSGGAETLAALKRGHGPLPKSPMQTTGNGFHVAVRVPSGVRNLTSTLPGVDVKTAGGQIVAAPSKHFSGARYAWRPGYVLGQCPIAPVPSWLSLEAKATKKTPLTGMEWVKHVEGLRDGNRNEGLTKVAGLLFSALPSAFAAELVHLINQEYCKPPLGKYEVETIVESITRRELARFEARRGGR